MTVLGKVIVFVAKNPVSTGCGFDWADPIIVTKTLCPLGAVAKTSVSCEETIVKVAIAPSTSSGEMISNEAIKLNTQVLA